MNDVVLFGKALADPTRVRALLALMENDLCVCELSDALELSVSTLSTHLQTIRQAGIVETNRRHKWVEYAVSSEARPVLDAVFSANRAALLADRRLQRDADRIRQRLAMRVDGVCCHGPGQLAPASK